MSALEELAGTEAMPTDTDAALQTPIPAPFVPDHLAFIEGIRALAALYIMIHHMYLCVFWFRAPTGPFAFLITWLTYGRQSVALFIMLSGYCLMLPVLRGLEKDGIAFPDGVTVFWKKRFRRIMPPYYAALVFCLLVIRFLLPGKTMTIWDVCVPVNAQGIWSHLLLLNNVWANPDKTFFGNTQINGVFWSIAVESQIYLTFPLMVAVWRRRGAGRATLGIVGVACVLFFCTLDTPLVSLNATFYALFAVGMLASFVSFALHPLCVALRRDVPWLSLLLLLLGLLVVLLAQTQYRLNQGWYDLLFAPAGFVLLITPTQSGGLSRALRFRPLVLTGKFSYSLYLLHMPLLSLLFVFLIRPMQYVTNTNNPFCAFALLVGIGSPLILFLAYEFYSVFERPFMSNRARRQ